MHEFHEEDIDTIVQPTALFIQPDDLKTTERDGADTNQTKNHQENGA